MNSTNYYTDSKIDKPPEANYIDQDQLSLLPPPARAREISKASTLTRLGHSKFKPEKSSVIH